MKKFNIAIDASFALGEKNGTSVYTNQIIKNISKLDHTNNYTLFPFFTYIYNPNFKKYQPNLPPNFKIFMNNFSIDLIDFIWNKMGFLKRFFTPKYDIFHTTTFTVPPKYMYKKLVVTIYDVSFYTHPQFHIKENVNHCQRETTEAVKKADIIIAISNSTKSDLVKYFDCPADKIIVTHLGYDRSFEQKVSIDKKNLILSKHKIEKPFIFHLGSLEPRKNTLGLIKAYRFLPKKLQDKYQLIIGGGKGWMNNDISEYVLKHKLSDNIKFLGYVPDTDLPAFYQSAKCFVYPSFYEGFGIPPLEAMTSGCPVLVSDISCLPEIYEDSALYCHPNNIEDMGKKLKYMLLDDCSDLIKRGIIQSRKYSWEKSADITLKIYNKLFNNSL
jgi:glycosyltransferase involved in cell wall biosynthesis